jgi:iron complex outermembrane receptor protein
MGENHEQQKARTRKKLLYALVGSSLLWSGAFTGYAAEAPIPQPAEEQPAVADKLREFDMEPLFVTAERDSLPPAYAGGQIARGSRVGLLGNRDFMDTPFNTTSYTAETIENQQIQGLAGVLAKDPAVRDITGTSYSPTWTIRGLSVGTADVGFNGLYGLFPYTALGTEFVERVEVHKGLSALLNGVAPNGGSLGGSINLVPKRAGAEPVTRFTTTYTGDGQLGGHLDVGRRFGEDGRYGFRLNTSYRDGDTGVDGEKIQKSTTMLSLDMRDRRFYGSLDLGHQKIIHQGPTTLLRLDDYAFVPKAPKSSFNFNAPWTRADNDMVFGVIHGEYELNNNWQVYASAGARESNYTNYQFGYAYLKNSQGDFAVRYENAPLRYTVHTEEFGVRGKFSTGELRHQLALSANQFTVSRYEIWPPERIWGNTTNLYNPTGQGHPVFAPAANRKGLPKDKVSNLSGLALADTISTPDDRLQLTLGLRRQTIESYDLNTTGARSSHYDDSATTPAVGFVIKSKPNVSFYGNYIEGLQQGAIADAAADNGGEIMAPYKSKQYEIGVKLDGGTFATTLNAYQIKVPSAYTNPDTKIFGAYGEQRHRGLELSVFGEPVKGTRLMGGIALIDGELGNMQNSTTNGNRPIGVPRWGATLGVEWDVPSQRGLTLTADAVYNGPVYVDAANTLKVPSWTRFDVGARYVFQHDNKPVTIRATVVNILDKNHWIGNTSGSLAVGGPRTFVMSATTEL